MDRVLTCRSCCPSCGLHFTSDSAFDLHLSEEGHRDPREVRRRDGSAALVVRTGEGECRMVVAARRGRPLPAIRPVVLWERAGREERVAAMRSSRATS
jgi:hypothetical protein